MSSVNHTGKPAEEWAGLPGMLRLKGGFMAWYVADLVRLAGAQRAGVRVVERIEQKLAENGIGHLPPRLPFDGSRQALLYAKSYSSFGSLLHRISTLATQDPAEGNNAKVTELETLLTHLRKYGENKYQADSR
ncbi:hypothetical protein ABT117_16880 [Streptomyces sp. NPDC002262]|uniref:hypothetical protein n=1 Tax=Streptomyces sp. NPDC002262 TaxID=3154414 RepID=UPI00332C0415